jgi:hypothetical protein
MLSGSIIDDSGEIKGVGLWLLDRRLGTHGANHSPSNPE